MLLRLLENLIRLQRGGGINSRYCKGDNTITLTQCQNCGYVFNSTFDFEKISKEYQNESYLSRKIVSKSMNNVIKIIKNSISKYIDSNTVCLEVAPGSGDMVNALIHDVQFIYTVDPSMVSLEIESANNLKHIQGFFDYDVLKDKLEHKIDFIIFRHLLEHINTPLKFLQDVVKLIEDGGVIYIEVPNIEELIKHKRFYEIFNDHCGYYQKNILINTLNSLNCECIDEIFLFREQHIGLFFKKRKKYQEKLSFQIFNEKISKNFQENIEKLNTILHKYNNIAIYGSGAHGNSIITFLNHTEKIIKCFDLDARKQGKYLQNSKIIIQEPKQENFKDIDCIIIAAPLYEKEIIKSLREKGYQSDIIATEKEIKIL